MIVSCNMIKHIVWSIRSASLVDNHHMCACLRAYLPFSTVVRSYQPVLKISLVCLI